MSCLDPAAVNCQCLELISAAGAGFISLMIGDEASPTRHPRRKDAAAGCEMGRLPRLLDLLWLLFSSMINFSIMFFVSSEPTELILENRSFAFVSRNIASNKFHSYLLARFGVSAPEIALFS